MKSILLSLSVLSMLTIASCSKKDNGPSNSAQVMFVNGAAGVANVSATYGSIAVPNGNTIAYLKSSGYQNIIAGTDSLTFQESTSKTKLKAMTTTLTANTHYTAFLGGSLAAFNFLFTTDDLAAPSSGHAKIRFVNLTNEPLSESVSVGTTTVATGVTANNYTPFSEVASGSYTIKAGDPSSISSVVSVGPQQLDNGKIYTVMLTGTAAGSGTSGLTLTVLNNN